MMSNEIMLFLRCLTLLIGSLAGRQIVAQHATADSVALRRSAIYSALMSRAAREGAALRVGLCSVVKATGFAAEVRSGAPSGIEASLAGEGTITCPSRGGAQSGGPWERVGEVLSANIAGPVGGGMPSISVVLRVWEQPGTFADEVYDFIASGPAPWTPVRYQWQGRSFINLMTPEPRTLFVILNGEMMAQATSAEILKRVRGQVVDSIRIVAADDSSYVGLFGSKAAAGGVIIGTHPAGRRR